MTLVAGNPVVTGTQIATAWGNPTMTDFAAEIQNSLDRGGRGAMTASLKAFAGTVSAPGYSWAVDLDSGWYRQGSANFRFSIDGVDAFTLEPTKASFPGTIELGHASDTTLSRLAAGQAAVEGLYIRLIGSSSSYTGAVNLVADHLNRMVKNTSAGVLSLTIQPDVDLTLPTGFRITLFRNAAGGINVIPGAGVTLQWLDGSGVIPASATRAIAVGGFAELFKSSANTWCITGIGIS